MCRFAVGAHWASWPGWLKSFLDFRCDDRTFTAAAVLSGPNQNEVECDPYDLDVLDKESGSAGGEKKEMTVAPLQL